MADAVEQRLGRIEAKLDKLADVMTEMARIEERMMHEQESRKRMWKSIEALALRLDAVEKTTEGNSFVTRRVERFAWAVIVAGVGLGFYLLRSAF